MAANRTVVLAVVGALVALALGLALDRRVQQRQVDDAERIVREVIESEGAELQVDGPALTVETSVATGALIKDIDMLGNNVASGIVHVLLSSYPETQQAVVDLRIGTVEPVGVPLVTNGYTEFWWGAGRRVLYRNANSEFVEERRFQIVDADSFEPIVTGRQATVITMSDGGLAAVETGDVWSPGGARLEVWNGLTGDLLLTVDEGLQGLAFDVAFGPEESEMAILERVGESSIITRWRLADGQRLGTYELPNSHSSWGVSYSPEGDRVAAAVTDPRDTVLEWNLRGGTDPTRTYPHTDGGSIFVPRATSATYSPTGELLVAVGGEAITVWDTRSGQLVGVHKVERALVDVLLLDDDSGMIIARNVRGVGILEVLRYP